MSARKTETSPDAVYDFSLLTDDDLYLFNEGSHLHLYEKLGSHLVTAGDMAGAHFAVWAPNAKVVTVIGDFNSWDRGSHPLRSKGDSGIWEGFVPGIGKGTKYKYWIESAAGPYKVEKADPFAIHAENPPQTASIIWDREYEWNDADWMQVRSQANHLDRPISVYEMHIGSWRRVPEDNNRWLSYQELAPQLADYLNEMGFTHVEFLPVMEHPFYGSWGYQGTGFFAPTSRYGTPQQFAYLVDYLHRAGIGVILDWVPSHFPSDEHGLAYFDGTHLFEHADPRQGYHPDWGSYIFNYGRNEVRSFLMSSGNYWLEKFHVDALRVDAVASMLYLDYSRKAGEWIPNKYGGRENLDAVEFLRRFNTEAYGLNPGIHTIAEESTAWPGVSRPTYLGGLGFGMKWDMGWMHDTLQYIQHDPIHRKFHHNELTFRMVYAFTENFVLALSHDEVVHGKGSLISRMPGDDWQKAANVRLLFAYMYGQPGKKLLFMGQEFGQWKEWNHESSLQWDGLEHGFHRGIQRLTADLNATYRTNRPLHEIDFTGDGFEWIDANDYENSCLAWIRKDRDGTPIIVACNFTPVPRFNYRVGVPLKGTWREILNSDAEVYGGSGQGNMGAVESKPVPMHGRSHSLNLTLPPLGAVFLRHEPESED
ncbi:MAG TPA: 1,4-alpha-glucan branching protein GlgB [Dehalococcoidia bacterium]|nr:1,4-alpha-glucan branching protein GlgB [Dehalococcoidia bacterium]